MAEVIILVDHIDDYVWEQFDWRVMTTRDYLTTAPDLKSRAVKVLNLSRDYGYLGLGYYCSLLAEARRHKVVPTATAILDLRDQSRRQAVIAQLDAILRRTIRRSREEPEGPFSVTVFFGRTDNNRFVKLSRAAYERFRFPVLRIEVRHVEGDWRIHAIRPVSVTKLDAAGRDQFGAALDAVTKLDWRATRQARTPRYSIGILYNPREEMPPSNRRALEKLIRVGAEMDVAVELITRKDFARLGEYDGLFIRETTAIDHHTFRFAKKAEQEGMAVIDDPTSIIRCTNKVYLAELLAANKIPTPRTLFLHRRNLKDIAETLSFLPVVLKVPDGSFSRGVVKVDNIKAFKDEARRMLEDSDLILAQEYMYTPFDWRIGVLAGRPLFACQYGMAESHWQIYNHAASGDAVTGNAITMAVEDVPAGVVDTALRACRLMGDGLYGVDLKQGERGVFVIEVNDNPNIDAGIEDKVLKDRLYRTLLEEFIRRIERRPLNRSEGPR